MSEFSGKKVVVTGAGKGIGKGLAIELAKNGALVFAVSRTQEDLDNLKKEYPSMTCICLDLTDSKALRTHMEALPDDITMLVNNAGIQIVVPFLEAKEEDFDRMLQINLKASYLVAQIVARKMVTHGKGGSIVNVSSILSKFAILNVSPYCVSKGGLDQLTRCMAVELGPYRIRTNTVNPSGVLTNIMLQYFPDPETHKQVASLNPLNKLTEVKDVVNAIMYLLSDKSDMINGVCIPVDGGQTVK